MNKLQLIEEAVAQIPSGASVMVGGFGSPGTPFSLINELLRQGQSQLTLIKNDANEPGIGISKLIENRRVDRLITSHIGLNAPVVNMMNSGELAVEFFPQGILAEKIRVAGAGSYAFVTDIGIETEITNPDQLIEWQGQTLKLEAALAADYALIHAARADSMGNLTYRGSAINFNPIMAMAANHVIAESAEIAQPGDLAAENIHTSTAFVSALVNAPLTDEYGFIEGRFGH